MDDNIAGTPVNSEEVDFPQSPRVVSSITRNTPVTSPSAKDKELKVKLRKTMDKVKTNQTGIQRGKVKHNSPRRIAPRPLWKS